MRVELHLEARAELRAAAIWYDERRLGLGNEFVMAVSTTLGRVGDSPTSFPVWPGVTLKTRAIRQAVIHRFPYVIAFEMHSTHVLVLAIAHQKRRPGYWLERG